MTRLGAFARFWYDFVVGDDWRVAVGVGAGIARPRRSYRPGCRRGG